MAIDTINSGQASQITGAIQRAANSTGMSFQYLLTTAQIESNFNPQARASTSSAQGLYQFIDQTWLATMKEQGPQLGYGKLADSIVRNASGGYEVPDPVMRQSIMRLRQDPATASMMAGAFARNNADQLAGALGRDPSEGELYIAHFLGSDGAAKLIGAAQSQPQTKAATLFPQAAAANPSIFYDRNGGARSVTDVVGKLTGRYETARALAFNERVPDTAGITQAFAAAKQDVALPDTRPLFQAMFTDRARKAVDQTVSQLWAPKQQAQGLNEAKPLDLFTDSKPDTQRLFSGKA